MAFQRPFLISLRREDSREPWGFRLDGGGVTDRPVAVEQVLERSLAEKSGLHEGDQVIQVGRVNVQGRTLSEVQELILTCRNRVELFIIREDLLRDRKENEPLTLKAVVHSPYNSPLQLYSQDNVAETLATQALILSDPGVQPDHLGPKSPPTVFHSNVLDALREQGERGPRLNGEIVTTPPRKKKQPPPVPPKPYSPTTVQSPPVKAAVYPGNMEQMQYQNYSTYHREEKRSSQRTSSYGDYEVEDGDMSIMYPQQKTFKSQTSFTPLQPESPRSPQAFQQENRLRDYQQQREEEIRRAEILRQQEQQQQLAFEEQQRQLREQQQRQTSEQQQRQIYEQQQRQVREQQAREQQAREQQLREQRAREQQAFEQQRAREQAAREQQLREQRSREQQARDQERLAAQQRQRYEQQQQAREAQSRQQSQAQLQARQYEQQRLAEQRKAQEAYEQQQRQAQLRAQPQQQQQQYRQPQFYAQPQTFHHDTDPNRKMTSTTRVGPANIGSPTTQRKGFCPSWPPKNSSVRELPRTGFSPTFVQERGSKEFVWPPPKPEDFMVKDGPVPHVQGHAGEAWHPQSSHHASRPLVPRSPTPTRRCGDAVWPPPHVAAAEAGAYSRPSPVPVCRRGRFDDYITQNTSSNVPPTYRVPPGTVHVVY